MRQASGSAPVCGSTLFTGSCARRPKNTCSPIGLTLRTSPEPRYPSTVYEIVGVIPDTQYNSLRGGAQPMVFAPDSQHPAKGPGVAIMVYSSLDSAAVAASIRRTIAATHPEVIMDFMDFQARIRSGLVRERLLAMLAGFFGALAAVLAAVGLYGMISLIVARRQLEIGVRLALGARRQQVVAMVMRQASLMVVVGVAVGTGLALLAGQSVGALLFGLQPHDPPTLMAAGLLLVVIAMVATFIPARRASKLDPLLSLRSD